jgi:hypothetical protein
MQPTPTRMSDNQIKHLELITQAINRMANNSALMKGWSVTLVVGLFVLSQKETHSEFVYVAFIPVLCFWFLDIMYLYLEKAFRDLYNQIRLPTNKDTDFNMNIQPYKTSVNWWKAFKSWSTYLFHLPLLVILSILICILESNLFGFQ